MSISRIGPANEPYSILGSPAPVSRRPTLIAMQEQSAQDYYLYSMAWLVTDSSKQRCGTHITGRHYVGSYCLHKIRNKNEKTERPNRRKTKKSNISSIPTKLRVRASFSLSRLLRYLGSTISVPRKCNYITYNYGAKITFGLWRFVEKFIDLLWRKRCCGLIIWQWTIRPLIRRDDFIVEWDGWGREEGAVLLCFYRYQLYMCLVML